MSKKKKPVDRSGDTLLNGSGIYRRENILNINDPVSELHADVPRIKIKEIRAIHHQGEVYINAKDVSLMMRRCSLKFNSASVMNFVRRFIVNLIQ